MARMKAKTAVERMKDLYPGMSQAVYSMARNPEKYGVRLTPEARFLAGLPSTREIEKNRAKKNRLVCRVDDRTLTAINRRRGDMSVQAFVERALVNYYGLEVDEKWND